MPSGVYPRPPLEERFWAKVDRRGPDDCWEWQGARHGIGHGVFGADATGAHRVSWELHNGPIPDGLLVRHSCDNPPCVNPAHLLLGTQADNVRDRVERGRSAHIPGAAHQSARLTWPQVTVVWRLAAIGESQRAIAEAFGVNQATISRVLNRPTWRIQP